MKIDVNGGYGAYRKNVQSDTSAAKSSGAGGSKKASGTDVIEISRGHTAGVEKGFTSLKANLQRDISQSASSDRIEQLRADIKNGTYRISTDALVDSILGD